ncbi:hypothetical protein [Paenibacillus ehimensis]|uniref:Phage ABA sandwich domain-containing protein n=1 Tax=Paenibacillus ehimensis TaxID=79264 RepID=A0ABT8VML7_9BACL|nr:hypothetical protein [Paenibacillus ehimensis]MDO3682202.1 hypothetical protein [Paenibacillus ehimensis]
MKAYHIHDKENSGEEAFHEIVFAETASKAKYASEAYSNGVPWTEISVTRKPEFDQYANIGRIPRSAYIGMGLVLEKVKTLQEDVFIEIDYEKGRWACYIWFGVIKKAEAFASEAPYAVAMAALLALRGGASG